MKKLLRFADCFVLLAAIIGCILRLWLQNTGIDNKGLYQTNHPAWLLLCLVSAAILVFLWFVTCHAGDDPRHSENFRPTRLGAATYLLVALVLTYTCVNQLLDATAFLEKVTAMAGMLSAVMLAVTAFERYWGHRPAHFLQLMPCLYFALRMFNMGRVLGTEPEICTFLFGFLASIALTLAFFHLWAFDLNMGNRRWSLFWSLSAAFFCLIATFESTQEWVPYMSMAALLLSNLCSLQYLEAPQPEEAPAEETPVEEAPVEEAPVEEIPAEEAPVEEAPAEEAPVEEAPVDDLDVLLADLRSMLGEDAL